jgi:DNA-binding NtrC family response regulator/tetratricopeptide (TPR) repeat protein
VWSDECAELARMRHPVLNRLVDFGLADRDRTFEAYAANPPLRVSVEDGAWMLTHAVRFLEARRVPLTATSAPWVVREVLEGSSARRRPVGIVLQPRSVHAALVEALQEAAPGGTAAIDVSGGPGSGLRTLRALTARAARLAGYVPVSSAVLLRMPCLHASVIDRHVCVFMEDRHSSAERIALASFLTSLAIHSARRHLVLNFARTEHRRSALEIDCMGISALTEMVFVDRDFGPAPDEILRAARDADGRPGAFLSRLRAASFGDHVSRIAAVHESSAVYAYAARSNQSGATRRRLRATLIEAASRAVRLATRGRHTSARRLLGRAAHALEGRGEIARAATCLDVLAWLDRNRGHGDRAAEGFTRAKRLAGDSGSGASAAIGLGVLWTDQRRFAEAEAALRGACAAAGLLAAADVQARAALALARCLYWQGRHDEAAVVLTPFVGDPPAGAIGIEAHALLARNSIALGDVRAAISAAAAATEGAGRFEDARLVAVAARAMVVVQRAVGDIAQARTWVDRGLRAAAAAHLPLAKLRFKAFGVATSAGSSPQPARAAQLKNALRRCALPKLLEAEIDGILGGGDAGADRRASGSGGDGRCLNELQQLLEVVQGGQDDQAALSELCQVLIERLRAATVQVVAGLPEVRTLARAGRPWQGEGQAIERILSGGAAVTCGLSSEPQVAAHPIRYGQESIGVLCCRWTAGLAAEPRHATALLHAGALAAAAPVRSVLDRSHVRASPTVCGELIGSSPAAVQLRDAIMRAARAPFPVLIEGESGSGKELVARGIHRLGTRRDRRLCTVNCAALSDDLLEAELFGHARGAFTGAIGERAGLFEEADGGTLFLDEVGELSPRAQAKLLRVLQDGEVRRVGENLPRRVDARIVAATNRRLSDEVATNHFRADLRFRLDVVRIAVPSLRERATDIPALAGHFWTEASSRLGSSATLTADTLAALARYDWPGNVRELQNAIASLAVHAPRRGRVVPSMLPAHIARSSAPGPATFDAARQDFERRYVRAALAQAGGHRAHAARALGVSRQGLAKMMRRLRIDD